MISVQSSENANVKPRDDDEKMCRGTLLCTCCALTFLSLRLSTVFRSRLKRDSLNLPEVRILCCSVYFESQRSDKNCLDASVAKH